MARFSKDEVIAVLVSSWGYVEGPEHARKLVEKYPGIIRSTMKDPYSSAFDAAQNIIIAEVPEEFEGTELNERSKRVKKPSEIAAVLFNRDDGWTPSKSVTWVKTHIGGRQKAPVNMESAGGDVLAKGDYIKIRLGVEHKSHSSYGYKAVGPRWPGVYFMFGGHRKRPAKKTTRKTRRRTAARDHISPSGQYYLIYKGPRGDEADGPHANISEARAMAKDLVSAGIEVFEIREFDPTTGQEALVQSL